MDQGTESQAPGRLTPMVEQAFAFLVLSCMDGKMRLCPLVTSTPLLHYLAQAHSWPLPDSQRYARPASLNRA